MKNNIPSDDLRKNYAEIELLRMLAESDEDARQGRVAPIEKTFDGIRATLRSGTKD